MLRSFTRIGLVMTVAVAMSGQWALAQDQGHGNGREHKRPAAHQQDHKAKQHGDREKHGDRKNDKTDHQARMRQFLYEHLLKGIDLSADQKTKIDAIVKDQQEAQSAWFEKNREALDNLKQQMREAHQSKDREQTQALRKKRTISWRIVRTPAMP